MANSKGNLPVIDFCVVENRVLLAVPQIRDGPQRLDLQAPLPDSFQRMFLSYGCQKVESMFKGIIR
jgi:hypothetical protein